jgi:hypothetical protein
LTAVKVAAISIRTKYFFIPERLSYSPHKKESKKRRNVSPLLKATRRSCQSP